MKKTLNQRRINRGQLFGIATLITLVLCQSSCLQSKTTVNPENYKKGILWSIQHPNSNKVSYLLGTIHQMDTNLIKLPLSQLEELAAETDMVCLETIEDTGKANFGKLYKQLFLADTTRNVMNSLDQDSKEKLVKIFKSSKLKDLEPMLSKMEPGVLTFLVVAEKQSKSRFFKTSNFSPEGYFKRIAKERNMKIVGLEKSGDGLDLFKSDKDSFLPNVEELKRQLASYENQDMDIYAEYKLENLNLSSEEVIQAPSFIKRNETMVSSIDSLIKGHTLFILVGVAHLPGKHGVLRQLVNKGYKVRNIKLLN